ncbi:MAG: hypothetical protein FGM33_04900 [Candidatus Kapabacteria bacterium]|nr:hypothetical protein [Candidatus Kapabacteria bacterium]
MKVLLALLCCGVMARAQGGDSGDNTIINGSLQTDVQQYGADSLIGAPDVPEQILSNTFFNLTLQRGKFSAGVRFESYQGPLLGIDPRFGSSGAGTGIGIPYRFVKFADETFEVTAGNFYEQFGSGMILRTYEERNLGFDNSIDGVRLKYMPTEGMTITGLIGRQRAFFALSDGIMRGADLDLDVNQLKSDLLPEGTRLTLGLSGVSRFQADDQDVLKIPENVFAWSTRANLVVHDLSLDFEYAYKINDPSATNASSFNPGSAIYASASWAGTGLGINIAAKRIDNMDLRSDRTATGFAQQVNYLPALSKQHTLRLITLYPYATQPTGEFALQADVAWTIPKGGWLGNDETMITLNGSLIHGLDTTHTGPYTYDAEFMWGDDLYYRDVNIEIQRKFGRDFKTTLTYVNLDYNQDVIERRAAPGEKIYGIINASFVCLELWFKTAKNQSLRTELQYMDVTHEPGVKKALQNGDWIMALAEYTVSPHWFFTLFNEYNFGNEEEALRVHYPNASVAYSKDALRIQAGYGRVRGGILCVGGICRPVPASNGASMSITYTF